MGSLRKKRVSSPIKVKIELNEEEQESRKKRQKEMIELLDAEDLADEERQDEEERKIEELKLVSNTTRKVRISRKLTSNTSTPLVNKIEGGKGLMETLLKSIPSFKVQENQDLNSSAIEWQ
jgi:hypothetical protein